MPKVTATGRPLWEVYEREVPVPDKESGKVKKRVRYCVGHEDGEFVEKFVMKPMADHFAKILNERDEALELLARATGKHKGAWRKATKADLVKGRLVRWVGPWDRNKVEQDPGQDDAFKSLHGKEYEVMELTRTGCCVRLSTGSVYNGYNINVPYEVLEVEG